MEKYSRALGIFLMAAGALGFVTFLALLLRYALG